MNSSGKQLETGLITVVVAALLVSGCSGLLLLAQYMAVASTIDSIFGGDDDPCYTLAGVVYIDRGDNKIGISNSTTPPSSSGDWEFYPEAKVTIDTTPVRTTTTNVVGYFIFDKICNDTRVVLSVEAPDGKLVKFDVRLNTGTITPLD